MSDAAPAPAPLAPPRWPRRLRAGLLALLPWLLTFLVTTAVVCGLFWPLPLQLTDHASKGYFHDGHVWAFDQMARMVTGELEPYLRTDQTGFPRRPEARFIAWAPALAAIPFRPWLGPLGAYNVAMLGSLGVGAAMAALWIRRITGAHPYVASLCGVLYGLSPFALACLASGQTCKAQIWILPAALLLLRETMEGPNPGEGTCSWRRSYGIRVLALLGFGVTCFLGGVSEPTHVLLLPFLLAAQAAASVVRGPDRLARLVFGLLAAGLAAAVLRPVEWYYHLEAAFSAFRPADRNLDPVTMLLGIAQPKQLLFPPARFLDPSEQTLHLPWLGRVLPAFAALALLRRFPGRFTGLALVVIGVGIAMGEYLYIDDQPALWHGARIRLPDWWLNAHHYPLSQSGQYYRAVVAASLGMPLLLAGGLSRLRPWLGVLLAAGIGGASVYEVIDATSALWPRVCERVAGLDLMREIAADPGEGAVMELPLEMTFPVGQRAMLSAAYHRRPTSAMPRITLLQDIDVTRGLDEVLRLMPTLGATEGRARLHRIGFRYLVWRTAPASNSVSPETLIPILGPPMEKDGVRYWRIDDP